jgi:hypothetical protein
MLRNHFLPDPFNPLGIYSDATRVQAHTRAFLVLSHAEVESYLEEWAKEIARTCEVLWNLSSKISGPLTFLLATLSERIEIPTTLASPKSKDSPQRLADASVKLFQKYYKQIKDNNGIREKNVLALFSPLGVPAAALGPTLLPNLDSFGALRGQHAHQSAKAVQAALDPEIEHKRVTALVNDLQVLDEWLMSYKRRIR